jgi:monoamine oxidase
MQLYPSPSITRREVLRLAGTALAAAGADAARPQTTRPKKVIVAGGGIGGLSCGYELLKRGHDVTVLEASGRTGGHVFTFRDQLPDGFYVDAGAEHFTQPGYEICWQYIKEFNLRPLGYPKRENYIRFIDGKMYTDEMLADPKVLKAFGLNQREVDHIVRHGWSTFSELFLGSYIEHFRDEYHPFGVGLDNLDDIPLSDVIRKEGASQAALNFVGGSGSALQAIWEDAILKLRGVPSYPTKVYRLEGGNQRLPDMLAKKLGDRVRLGSPVVAIEHGSTGVTVTYQDQPAPEQHVEKKKMEADYLVCCMSAVMLRRIPVTPAWSESKNFAISNMPYYFATRPIFVSRSRFWEKDGIKPDMSFGDPALGHIWRLGEDVDSPRGLLAGTSVATTTTEQALSAYRKYYPGKSEDISQAWVVEWSKHPWAGACERIGYKVGELKKYWPHTFEPQGRVHFAGAYADNLGWGMEAATRSAHRVVKAIDGA